MLLLADTGVSACDLDLELVRLTGDLKVCWFSSSACAGSGLGGRPLELLLGATLLSGDKGVMASL